MSTHISIAAMAELSGLTPDTLRWYEKEGMLPRVERASDGRRRYGESDQTLIMLLATLRGAGMSTAAMKEFVQLLDEGAASHGRRMSLLLSTREELLARQRALTTAMAALEHKLQHYRDLIDAGLDCDGAPVPPALRPAQQNTHRGDPS